MLSLNKNTIKKGQVNQSLLSIPKKEFEAKNNKGCKIKKNC